MKHETQVETLQALLELHEQGRHQEMAGKVVRVPVRLYTEPTVLEQELATAFRDYPLVVGHAAQVREPGSYLLSPWNRLPFVVVRDKEGTLRAFLNVCKHRGARLVSGKETQLNALVCPFHGWAYGLDGKLKGVTKSYNFPDLDCAKHNLTELAVAEHAGLIFVHPTPGAKIQLSDFLGREIETDLRHFALDQLVSFRKSVVTKNANWKLLMNTFMEVYHIPSLHRNTIAEFFKKSVITHITHGPHIRFTGTRTNVQDALQVDPSTWQIHDYASVFYTLFPNTLLIIHTNVVLINSFYPLGPDKTIWIHDMLYREADYPGEEGKADVAKRLENIHAVFDQEDFAISENVQSGLRSGANEFHTLGLEEGLLALFQENVNRVQT
jgi:phenylpropionate dioxygenase-like ring-hydroxylating dioxygenase large terminal subunit